MRLLAVDGPSGAGKSVLADHVVAALRAAGVLVELVRTDHFATWADPVDW
jgi:cytidylate kinase